RRRVPGPLCPQGPLSRRRPARAVAHHGRSRVPEGHSDMTDTAPAPETPRERALRSLTAARDRTTLLTTCVEDPDLTAQHSPLMSPLVWDLAHIGNQEEQWLLRRVGGQEALRPE